MGVRRVVPAADPGRQQIERRPLDPTDPRPESLINGHHTTPDTDHAGPIPTARPETRMHLFGNAPEPTTHPGLWTCPAPAARPVQGQAPHLPLISRPAPYPQDVPC
ncbi:hypothetical protein GCM10009736_04340 [Actinomadura bangladeshensis]